MLILPDAVAVDEALQLKLESYLGNGGCIIASGDSGIRDSQFVLDYGLEYVGPSKWHIDFTQVRDALSGSIVRSPYFNYLPGPETRLVDAEVLADTIAPHFNRTFDKFCSHGNTPPGEATGYPSVSQKGRIIYIGAKVFTMYREKGMRLHRELVTNCIQRLPPERQMETSLPSGAMLTLTRRPDDSLILHLLYATTILRGKVPVIEDIVPLYDIPVRLKVDSVSSVTIQPEGTDIDFSQEDGYCRFVVPKLEPHTMIEIRKTPTSGS